MSRISITSKLLSNLKPSIKPYFLRDSNLKGFGIKVNQSGAIVPGKMAALARIV